MGGIASQNNAHGNMPRTVTSHASTQRKCIQTRCLFNAHILHMLHIHEVVPRPVHIQACEVPVKVRIFQHPTALDQ